LAKNGIILPKEDPWWSTNYPPNAWGCKCEVRAWSERQIQKRGWSVSTAPHENIATPDWSFNPGGGAKYETENVYYKKTLASPFPMSDTLKTIDRLVDKNAFTGWVKTTLSDKTYPINETVAGVISSDVFDFLKAKDIIPDTPHIWLSKKSLTHMIRQVKQDKGIALSTIDILGIYDYLQSPSSILFDKEKKNIIYVFDNEKLGKIVVEVNYVSKSGVKNQILTGSILKEIPTGYEVIK
jgi:hypothetical protein